MSDPYTEERQRFATEDEAYDAIAQDIWGSVQNRPQTSWRMPWNYVSRRPTNPATGTIYKGTNIVLLWSAASKMRIKTHEWATPMTWRNVGGRIIDKDAGVKILMPVFVKNPLAPTILWNKDTPGIQRIKGPLGEDATGGALTNTILTGWELGTVYNIAHVKGADVPTPADPHPTLAMGHAERLLEAYRARAPRLAVRYDRTKAYYEDATDCVNMPPKEAFGPYNGLDGNQYFYAVNIHEHIHSTGSKGRLNRLCFQKYSSSKQQRAHEELVAELGAAFLGSNIGLSTRLRPDHAVYVESWLGAIKEKHRFKYFLAAVNQAQQACDYILGKTRPLTTVAA